MGIFCIALLVGSLFLVCVLDSIPRASKPRKPVRRNLFKRPGRQLLKRTVS